MKKKFTILLMVICVIFGSTTINAATMDECPYKSTHGKHSPHASNFECKMYVVPDYPMGQMHLITFWACKGCNYCCCNLDNYFGNLITGVSDECVEEY